jgi:hypothetical protein
VNGVTLTSLYRIEDEIFHALNKGGGELVEELGVLQP